MSIKYGISVPNFADYADPRTLAELAHEAEEAGWHGFFVWDHIQFMPGFRVPLADPWVLLAAIAMRTERVRLGALVTPIPRRRPWKLARETVTLDHLSDGRLIVGAGLGYPPDAEFGAFGEEMDDHLRAEKLDEGLAILAGLWSGEPFTYHGKHLRVEDATFLPTPIQLPRIPVWIAGYWPNRRPIRRAARWDGVVPNSLNASWDQMMPVDDVCAVVAEVRRHRESDAPFDVVIGGYSTGDDRAPDMETITPYIEAGITWWIENIHGQRGSFDAMRERVRKGPTG